MLEASCSLELSEWVLSKHRNPKETEEGIAIIPSKDTSSSGVLTESVRIESRPCSESDRLMFGSEFTYEIIVHTADCSGRHEVVQLDSYPSR